MANGATPWPSQIPQKMIAEKEFKTITLRGLEEKPELVQIMNDTMYRRDLRTGQSTIEYIIKDYQRAQAEIKRLKEVIDTERQKRNQEKDQYYKWRNDMEEQMQTRNHLLRNLKVIIETLNTLPLEP